MSTSAVPDPPPDRTSREPAMKVAGQTSPLVALATALVGVAVAFGAGLSVEQGVAIVTAVTALAAAGPLVSGWFTRGQVYAPATVARMLDETVAKTRDEAQASPPSALRSRWPGRDA